MTDSESTTDEKTNFVERYTDHSLLRRLRGQQQIFQSDRVGQLGLGILLVFILIGLFAPWIAPFEPREIQRTDGSIDNLQSPSSEYLFGTTDKGRDVFSQTILSTRISLIVGALAAFISVVLGTMVGIVSAFYGGRVDDILMRITDIVYSIPFLPFVIALILIIGPGLVNIILAISLVMWRATARVIRSQVLTIKQRPYIEAAKATGTSNGRIMLKHILPNVLPIVLLYGAFTTGWAIIAEASISFLGFGDPAMISWGRMIQTVYNAGLIRDAWWWVAPPGICITLLVISVFLISRSYEEVANPELN